MRRRPGSLITLLFSAGLGVAAVGNGQHTISGGTAVQPSAPPSGAINQPTAPAGVDASSVFLPCTPVAAYWTGPPQSEGMPPGPELAIVSVEIRPKDARLYLDGRFVGRARYLDGKPGYLYLAPGTYHLELRLDGYETVAVDLSAEAGCRFDLKHRLQRVKGTQKEDKSDSYGKGMPFNRVYAPLHETQGPTAEPARGPDPALRPDIGRERTSTGSPKAHQGASLKLSVSPATAAIAIDGEFVATAEELNRMVAPLAVSSGDHRIEFTAPGHRGVSKSVVLQDGEVLEMSVKLEAGAESDR